MRQSAREQLDVSIVAAPFCERSRIAGRLHEKIVGTVGSDVRVVIDFAEAIPAGSGGKRRAVVSSLTHSHGPPG